MQESTTRVSMVGYSSYDALGRLDIACHTLATGRFRFRASSLFPFVPLACAETVLLACRSRIASCPGPLVHSPIDLLWQWVEQALGAR